MGCAPTLHGTTILAESTALLFTVFPSNLLAAELHFIDSPANTGDVETSLRAAA